MRFEINDTFPATAGEAAEWYAKLALHLELLDTAFKEDAALIDGSLSVRLRAAGKSENQAEVMEYEALRAISTFRDGIGRPIREARHLAHLFGEMPAKTSTRKV